MPARRDASGNVYYHFQDQIGTSRLIATSGGTVCYDADYTPFGQELAYTTTCSQNYKFGGMERDTETANDHTWFRGYEWSLGRWLSPDPLGGGIASPQSLNRYAYVLNNPMTLIDPLGLEGKSNLKLQVEPTTADCTLNGIYMSCSVVNSAVNAGAAVACTSVNCGGLRPAQGPAGTTEWQQWVPPGQETTTLKDPDTGEIIGTYPGSCLPGRWEVVGRVPDFWQFSINVGPWWGGTFQVTIDRYYHVYVAPGVNIGKSLGGGSGSLSYGWMGPWNELPTSPTPPTPQALKDFLTRGGCSAGGMVGGGLLAAWSSGGQAWMPSVGTPQAGISCGYGFNLW